MSNVRWLGSDGAIIIIPLFFTTCFMNSYCYFVLSSKAKMFTKMRLCSIFGLMEWYIFSKWFLEEQTSSLQLELNLTHLQQIQLLFQWRLSNLSNWMWSSLNCMVKWSQCNGYVIQRIRITLDKIPTNAHWHLALAFTGECCNQHPVLGHMTMQ